MAELTTVDRLRRQQAALAEFGTFAFRTDDLTMILTEAARVCAECLCEPFAKICRYRKDDNDLLVVAGYGWHAGVVGHVVSRADESSTQGRAFVTGEPVILEDIAKNNSFSLPPFYAEHAIISTADVLIKGKNGSWGVLEVDSPRSRRFDRHDIVFLTGFANIIAEAVITSARTASMQEAITQMTLLIEEKDQLLLERTSHERRLLELQTELLHVSRLNAMGQMTAAIAHELNQPLAAIANYASAAKRTLDHMDADASALDRALEFIDKVQSQTLRAGGIIKNLREVVEKRKSERAPEDIGSLVKDSVALVLFGTHDAHIVTKLDIAADIPAVMIDKVQVQQILINLIRNSIEAMEQVEAKKLTITTRLGVAGFVDVTVQDTGPGVPLDVMAKLFQPFVTTKGGGMGLGLMICQTLAEANGGRIWSLEGLATGAGFCFSLPIATADDTTTDPLPLVA